MVMCAKKSFQKTKVVVFDNGVPFQETGCPVGTTLTRVDPADLASVTADFNGNDNVCVNGGGNLFTDDGQPAKDDGGGAGEGDGT